MVADECANPAAQSTCAAKEVADCYDGCLWYNDYGCYTLPEDQYIRYHAPDADSALAMWNAAAHKCNKFPKATCADTGEFGPWEIRSSASPRRD